MIKIIISIENNNYVLKKDKEVITTICMEKLILNGKELYNNLFSKIDLTKKIDIDVQLDTNIVDSKDKRLTNDIKLIIEQIIETLNEDFKLEGENS